MSTPLKISFIFNPSADRERNAQHLAWLRMMIAKHLGDSEIYVSEFKGHAVELSQIASQTCDIVVACGGDGTIQEVVQGIMGSSARLGILPMGSGNDFIKSAWIPRDKYKAFMCLLNPTFRSMDVIRYETENKEGICINTLGLGFDALINYETKTIKKFKGSFVYTLAVLKSLGKSKPTHFKISSDVLKMVSNLTMITLANGTTEGGNFKIAPQADISDGKFDIVLITEVSPLGILWRLVLFMIGQQHRSSKIRMFKSDEVIIESETGFAMHSDGEHIGLDVKHVNAKLLKSALEVVV